MVLLTYNGTPFKNSEFERYTKNHGIKHVFTAPGFPATNGQAESAVKIIKKGIKAASHMSSNKEDMEKLISKILFDYRSTQHTTTEETPAKLFLKRQIKHKLDLLRPPSSVEVAEKRQKAQTKYHKGRIVREFATNDHVWSRDYSDPNKKTWTQGKVLTVLGKRSYLVQLSGSKRNIKRHTDQLRKRTIQRDYSDDDESTTVETTLHANPEAVCANVKNSVETVERGGSPGDVETRNSPVRSSPTQISPKSQRSGTYDRGMPSRIRKAPDRLNYDHPVKRS